MTHSFGVKDLREAPQRVDLDTKFAMTSISNDQAIMRVNHFLTVLERDANNTAVGRTNDDNMTTLARVAAMLEEITSTHPVVVAWKKRQVERMSAVAATLGVKS